MDDSNFVDDGSWSITFSQKDDCIYIRTTEYHADPLKLSKHKLAELAGLFESVIQEKDNIHNPTQATSKPSDTQEIANQRHWKIGISKRNKLLFCENKDGIEDPLVISRDELYKYGKMMNKRVKVKKQTKCL